MAVLISVIAEQEDFLPVYSSDLAAGADVKACIPSDISIAPGDSALIPTGLKL